MSKSNGFESINVRMKELEEKAPYASEYDDYQDESDEVYGDQGNALPFSKGFHLVGQLVAAFNPYDLDAMDESIPLTKWALDQLLGYVSSAQDYAHYYGEFLKAQKIRKGDDRDDRIKRQMDWKSHMESFMSTKYSESLQCVQDFKRRLDSRYRPIRIPDDAFTAEQQALYQRPSPSSYQQSPPSTYQQPPPPTYQQPSTSYQQAPYLQPPPSTHQQPPDLTASLHQRMVRYHHHMRKHHQRMVRHQRPIINNPQQLMVKLHYRMGKHHLGTLPMEAPVGEQWKDSQGELRDFSKVIKIRRLNYQ